MPYNNDNNNAYYIHIYIVERVLYVSHSCQWLPYGAKRKTVATFRAHYTPVVWTPTPPRHTLRNRGLRVQPS